MTCAIREKPLNRPTARQSAQRARGGIEDAGAAARWRGGDRCREAELRGGLSFRNLLFGDQRSAFVDCYGLCPRAIRTRGIKTYPLCSLNVLDLTSGSPLPSIASRGAAWLRGFLP